MNFLNLMKKLENYPNFGDSPNSIIFPDPEKGPQTFGGPHQPKNNGYMYGDSQDFFLGGGALNENFGKNFLRKLRIMNYFSIFFKKF